MDRTGQLTPIRKIDNVNSYRLTGHATESRNYHQKSVEYPVQQTRNLREFNSPGR